MLINVKHSIISYFKNSTCMGADIHTRLYICTHTHTHTEIIKRFLSYKKRCKGNNSQTSRILRLCSSPFTKFVHAQSTSGGQRGDIQRLADPAKQAREEEQPIKYVQLASYFFHCKECFGYLCTYHCFEVFHPRDQSQSLSARPLITAL